jgi:flagellar biosynthesis protein FlhA
VAQEAEFYGSMDGASKFVSRRRHRRPADPVHQPDRRHADRHAAARDLCDAGKVYALLTIGDGLVAQLPSLLLSTAAAIMVTRASGSRTWAS